MRGRGEIPLPRRRKLGRGLWALSGHITPAPPDTAPCSSHGRGSRIAGHVCFAYSHDAVPGLGSIPGSPHIPPQRWLPDKLPLARAGCSTAARFPWLRPLLSIRGNHSELQGHSKTPSVQAPLASPQRQRERNYSNNQRPPPSPSLQLRALPSWCSPSPSCSEAGGTAPPARDPCPLEAAARTLGRQHLLGAASPGSQPPARREAKAAPRASGIADGKTSLSARLWGRGPGTQEQRETTAINMNAPGRQTPARLPR